MFTPREYTSAQYTTIATIVKVLLGNDTTLDDYIDAALPYLVADAELYCKRHFSEEDADDDGDWVMEVPQPVYLYLQKVIRGMNLTTGLKSERQGERAVEYASGGDTATWQKRFLGPLKRLDWHITSEEYVQNVTD